MSELDEVKNHVARRYGYENWEHLKLHEFKGLLAPEKVEQIQDDVSWTFIGTRAKQSQMTIFK